MLQDPICNNKKFSNYDTSFPWVMWSNMNSKKIDILWIKEDNPFHHQVVFWQHRVGWLSLIISPYHPLFLVGLLDCIQCLHRADVCKSQLVSHKRMSLMILSLPLQQDSCFVHLTWMVCEKGSKWLYSCCFLGCSFQAQLYI